MLYVFVYRSDSIQRQVSAEPVNGSFSPTIMSTTIESQVYFHGDSCSSLPPDAWGSQDGKLYVANAGSTSNGWTMVRPSSAVLSTYTLPRWDTLLTNISLKYRPPFARFSSSRQDYLDIFQFTVSLLHCNSSSDEIQSANASVAVEVIVSDLRPLTQSIALTLYRCVI